jgi:xanthine dehydrogenase YagR molybdenum-binding subunit
MIGGCSRRRQRLDGVAKVTGSAEYAGDARAPDMLHAALVLSTIASGTILSIDTRAASRVAGCAAIFSHENAPRLQQGAYRTWLQTPSVAHAGQPVAMVLAENPGAASRAARSVAVAYASDTPWPRLSDPGAPVRAAPPIYEQPSQSFRGNLDSGRASAAAAIDEEYLTPAHSHQPIERGIVLAEWREGKAFVRTATSGIFAARRTIAHALAIDEQDVVVQMLFQGGGFGAKGSAWWPSLILAVSAARQLGRPVRLELSREEMFSLLGRRSATRQRLALGADRSGKITFVDHLAIQETSPLADYSDPTCFATRSVYACPNVRTRHMLVTANTPQPNAMRAPGETPGSFALESALDELSHRLGVDPVAFRLANIAARDQHADRDWSSNGLAACLRDGAERFGWVSRPANAGRTVARLGQGVAAAYYPVFQAAASARVRLDRDGRVTLYCGNQDIGTGSLTVMAETVAAEMGVRLKDVIVEYGDTRLPAAPMAAGSMGTTSVVPAIQGATRALKAKIVGVANLLDPSLKGVLDGSITWHSPADIRVAGRSAAVSAIELLDRCSATHWEAEYSSTPTEAGTSSSAFGACFAEVEVDVEMGVVRLSRVTGVFAAGSVLNRVLAESQLIGAIVMGVGTALTEAIEDDQLTGLALNRSLGSYLLPTNADIPCIDVHLHAERDRNPSTGGAKGLGMIGSVGVSAAIANAVFDATGLRIRSLPISIGKVLAAANAKLAQISEPADSPPRYASRSCERRCSPFDQTLGHTADPASSGG